MIQLGGVILHDILIEIGIHVKLLKLINMFLAINQLNVQNLVL